MFLGAENQQVRTLVAAEELPKARDLTATLMRMLPTETTGPTVEM
jgi:hypothetical protein